MQVITLVHPNALTRQGQSILVAKANFFRINYKVLQNETNKNILNYNHFFSNIYIISNKILFTGTKQLLAEVSFGGSLCMLYQTGREHQN